MIFLSRLTPQQQNKLAAWWQASRPPFFIATLVPLFIALVLAGKDKGEWSVGLFLMILLASFFLHLATNLANDYFDFLNGVDKTETIGGSRAIQEKTITLPEYRKALLLLYAATLLLTISGVIYTGLNGIWVIIAFAFFCSYFYVAPPIRYGYHACGEIFVFLSMGLGMTAGCYYTLTGTVTWQILLLSVVVGLMVSGILYFQSMPEIYTDRASGKFTLANTLGPEKARILFRFWWPFIFILIVFLWIIQITAWPALLAVAASVPMHRKACRAVDFALVNDDWLPLDAYGHFVRKMYLFCGIGLIIGVALK